MSNKVYSINNQPSGFSGSAEEELMLLKQQLNRYNHEMSVVNEFSSYLQACHSLTETYPVIRHYMDKLFPNWSGSLYLFNDEKILAESVLTWGDQANKNANIVTNNDCWALRRGKEHISLEGNYRLNCNHVGDDTGGYICMPINRRNDLLGMIHIEYSGDMVFETDEAKHHYFESCQTLLSTTVDNLSSSIAGLKLRETLKQQAIRDPLTSLYNQRYMKESLERSIAQQTRSGEGIGVIMIDIDHFKKINDTYGHAAGDLVLTEFARVASESFRESDIVCRYGGEEFVVIMAPATQEQVMKRATDFCHKLRTLNMQCDGVALPNITASFGVSHMSEKFEKPAAMLKMADTALYEAKSAGRDQVVLHKQS